MTNINTNLHLPCKTFIRMQQLLKLLKHVFLLFPYLLFCQPGQGKVQTGSADLSYEGGKLIVSQSSKRAIIDWETFNIGKEEQAEFVLPSSSSSTLNRVTGNDLSEIYGSLKSNGELVLINPNGILIGPRGTVDAAGFIASTCDLKNEDFLKNQALEFKDLKNSQASIINEGSIIARSKDVLLLAKTVENKGSILAEKGKVDLEAGMEIVLFPQEENRIKVRLKKKGSVTNSGNIRAVQAELQASGGIAESLAVSNEGVIEAIGVGEKEGKLVLLSDEAVSVGGQLAAKTGNDSQSTGGKIHLLGDIVNLEETAIVDASASDRGGEILIGGDYRGQNPEIKNASYVYAHKDSTALANSIDSGNGGKIIYWADKGIDMRGRAEARGGARGGNGGLVEVSSKGGWSFTGEVCTLSPFGKPGKLLFDPYNLTINAAGPDTNVTGGSPFHPTASGAILTAATIEAAIKNNNVEINTSGGGGGEDGDVTIDSELDLAWTLFPKTLTIKADRNIYVNQDIKLTRKNIKFYINQAGNGGSLIFAELAAIERNTLSEDAYVYGNGSSGNSLVLGFSQIVYMTGQHAGYTRSNAPIVYPTQIKEFTNIQSITGNSKVTADTDLYSVIRLPDGGHTINVTGENQGNIENILPAFDNFPVLTGGDGEDTFKFTQDGYVDGLITGGGGSSYTNTLDLSEKAVESIFFVIFADDSGIDASRQFTSNAGWLGIGNIIGGQIGYSYIYLHEGAELSGTVTFLGTGNWVEYGYDTPITVDLTNNSATGIYGGAAGGFSNVQKFVSQSNIDNTVYCPNDGATVTLKGNDISTISSPSVDTTNFYYFPKIIGGSGDDTFKTDYNFSTGRYFINTLDGGAGYNTLDISSFPASSEGTFYTGTGSGSIPGSISSFLQINQVNLPNDQYLFADIMARTSILTNPDPESHSKSETTSVFMDLQTVPKTTALSNFIIKNNFVDWEIIP